MAIKPIRTALKIMKTMAAGYAGAAASGFLLGVIGTLAGMTQTDVVTAAVPVGVAGGLLTMTLTMRPMASARALVRVAGRRG